MQDQEFTLESIESQALDISQEALDIKRGVENVKKHLPTFFNTLTGFVNSKLLSFKITNKTFNPKLDVQARKVEYTDIRKKEVIVPHGLSSTYLEYLSTLDRCQDHCQSLYTDVLVPFEKFLGKLLTKPDEMRSVRENAVIDKVYGRDVDNLKQELSNHFDRKVGDKNKYGNLIERQRDVGSVITGFNGLKARTQEIKHDHVIEMVDLIVSHLDTLIERMNEDPDVYKASGITISSLTKLSYLLASEVEFYAVHNYNVLALEGSIEKALDISVGK